MNEVTLLNIKKMVSVSSVKITFSEYVIPEVCSNTIETSAQRSSLTEITTQPRQFTQQEIECWEKNSLPLSDILLARCEFPFNACYEVSLLRHKLPSLDSRKFQPNELDIHSSYSTRRQLK